MVKQKKKSPKMRQCLLNLAELPLVGLLSSFTTCSLKSGVLEDVDNDSAACDMC